MRSYLPVVLRLAVAAGLVAAAGLAAAGTKRLVVWRFEAGLVEADAGAAQGPLPVGSLQKPFVAKAWARAHPGQSPPQIRCDAASHCWLRSGHGLVGLTRAISVSCNTYFRRLAADTPPEVLAQALREEGFRIRGPVTPEAAIGLDASADAPAIAPEALLAAYVHLTRVPWGSGDGVREDVLAGLRTAALSGTAAGLGRRGFWAKTGTVPSLDGRPLATSGWVLAVDDSGWAVLASLTPGTGRDAAASLAEPLGRLRPWAPPHERPTPASRAAATRPGSSERERDGLVHVRLFDTLRPRAIRARNRGPSPVSTSRGFVGPGAVLELHGGDRLAEGPWELSLTSRRFTRIVQAALTVDAATGDVLVLHAAMTPREYAAGVIAAELADVRSPRREALGAAVLRFLRAGPRHGADDVCDSTHCAWFVGRGPAVRWPTPERAVLLARPASASADVAPLEDEAWARIQAAAERPGPSQWTSHCGGQPLSAHAVWGNGDLGVASCPRHLSAPRPWTRSWSLGDLRRAFGPGLRDLALESMEGVWTLRLETEEGRRDLRYDEAHRLLADVLGWSALPSPADRLWREGEGYRAQGVGLGHRVGLCLAD